MNMLARQVLDDDCDVIAPNPPTRRDLFAEIVADVNSTMERQQSLRQLWWDKLDAFRASPLEQIGCCMVPEFDGAREWTYQWLSLQVADVSIREQSTTTTLFRDGCTPLVVIIKCDSGVLT